MPLQSLITEKSDSLTQGVDSLAQSTNTTLQNEITKVAEVADSLASGELTLVDILKNASSLNAGELIVMLGSELIHIFFKILIALAIYFIGRWIIKRVIKFMEMTFEARQVEVSLRSFLKGMVNILLYVVLILTIVQLLGINTTSLVAMLASAGLAVGMALSGTLQNFAGGVMVLFLKPYRVGDFITAQDVSGFVKEIMLFTTVLETYDGRTIFLPNSTISSSIIDNYSHAGNRRLEWGVGMSYGDDFDVAKAAILAIIAAEPRIFQEHENPSLLPSVSLQTMADSSVNLVARAWTTNEHYWSVYYLINETLYRELPKHGVRFPFPQLDLHIKREE
ncbi:MAG: mechanosensitive ion channel domain-containing protein [Rikenellaceae bacterium]